MKKAPFNLATMLLLLVTSLSVAQGITRKSFLELGDKPLISNQFIHSNNGGTSFSSYTVHNESKVKEIIKNQKEDGFKKYDKAEFLLANTNALQASYGIQAGYTYRIFSIFRLPDGTSILRVNDQSGKELAPEIRNIDSGSIFSTTITSLQLQDIICTENQNIIIKNGMMSDKSIFYATTYLIFKKKS